ncbi:MAG TPA: hypothetical protein VFH29_00225 [Anaerolineales bacterium]|nr:hypothetical protein [Anaerolineales bacterium]
MSQRVGRDWISVAFISLVGAGIRILTVAGASFPLNDGGLFYAFTIDLIRSGLRLPPFSSYNAAGIPFVYPPLAFYLTAVLHLVTGLSALQILQFAPAIISVVTVPAFFAFALKVTRAPRQAVLSTLVFCLMPRAFDWLIMGGGITRSLGLLFYLLFLFQVWRLFALGESRAMIPAVLTGGLAVLSHPEAAVHAAFAAALMLVWHRHTRAGLVHVLGLGMGIVILTAPWWLTVVTVHGTGPWLAGLAAAQQDGHSLLLRLIALVRFDFTDEPFLRIFGVLGLFGLFVQVAKREYFLATWLLLTAVAEPRGGTLFMMVPLSIVAGDFLDRVFLPAMVIQALPATPDANAAPRAAPRAAFLTPAGGSLLVSFLFVYGAFAAYFVGHQLQQRASLGDRDLAALKWIADHGDPREDYALVTEGEPLLDPTSDWFPALTGRRSVASYFGSEWRGDLDFAHALLRYRALQACANLQAQCLREWLLSSGEPVDSVYVRASDSGGRTILQESLMQDEDFRLIYSADGIQIFDWRPSGGS